MQVLSKKQRKENKCYANLKNYTKEKVENFKMAKVNKL